MPYKPKSLMPWKRYTPEEWAVRILTIPDAHMRGWCASIIGWDYCQYTRFPEALEPFTVLFDHDQWDTRTTDEIVGALTSIGYQNAEDRCILRQDIGRDGVALKRKLGGRPGSI